MSLHTLAQQLQSAGRGEDKVLVHMTPAEVGGLQSLAKAHGGSLTINPETGLPEAGFLSSILPMIAGVALAPLTAGTSLAFLGTPMGAALTVGGITAATSGSLKKGLMAGLGAYGGAGLGQGLAKTGAAAANAATPVGTTVGSPFGATTSPTLFDPAVSAAQSASNTAVAGTAGAGTGSAGAAGLNTITTPTVKPIFDMSKYALPSNVPSVVPSVSNVAPVDVASTLARNSDDLVSSAVMDAQRASNTAAIANTGEASYLSKMGAGVKSLGQPGGFSKLYSELPGGTLPAGVASLMMGMSDQKGIKPVEQKGMIRPYEYTREQRPEAYDVGAPIYSDTPGSSRERLFFNEQFTELPAYRAPGPEYMADGGLAGLGPMGAAPVERMSQLNAIGANTGFPMANLQTPVYSYDTARPVAKNMLSQVDDGPSVGTYTGEPGFAEGGISNLGDYSDGGRLLKGPGDGVSDSIPAVIGNRQPARLADGEFVVPARIVSELGNGSTEAGARKLYAMMDRVQKARRKTVGKDKVAANTKSEKYLPA